MSRQSSTFPEDSVPVQRLERLVELSDQLEGALRQGLNPKAEDLLKDCPAEALDFFLPRLLALELECIARRGQKPEAAAYHMRFPDRPAMVNDLFADFAEQDITPPTDPHAIPETLGRYRVTGKLGQGAFGVVYAAYDDMLKRPVAIKVPHRKWARRKDFAANYIAEAQTLAALDHPHIVPVYDVGRTDDGLLLVVSKYIEGSNLAQRIAQGPIAIEETTRIVATIADALHYAHLRELVHRDVKPANILVETTGKAYLADFGLVLREEEFGKGPTFAGTPPYMSPEQARSEGHRVQGQSDIFSLGIVLYEMLTGRRPFEGKNWDALLDQIISVDPRPPRQIKDAIPREVERICLKALSKLAAQRYTTAKDMSDELREFIDEGDENVTFHSDRDKAAPQSTPGSSVQSSGSGTNSTESVKIVPKGLRSFDASDAEFFLELLPGPRDREGVPESLRFWLRQIIEPDADRTFSVGLIYGPSGCGKSSLVKAGLLPRLPKSIATIYLEATAEETEERLLARLHKQFPILTPHLDLADTIAALRRGVAGHSKHKVLIVIDQFEQWLHSRRGQENTELLRALRQCDGSQVQCLLLIRDDFWMAASRFMRELEIPIVDDETAVPVDLFDSKHSEHVLKMIGRAYGRLPDRGKLSHEQDHFITQSVEELSQDSQVIPVRLALFAEMVKTRDWTPATLRALGGIKGIGVTFLDEAFSGPSATPWHKVHEKAARSVLRALLPERGKAIKGNMRSHEELLQASGYADRPQDFQDLMQILRRELRLVSPSDAEGMAPDSTLESKVSSDNHYFQLTHDYLVPSLWEWLEREQKRTRRGRAELDLAERAAQWESQPRDRSLPRFAEWARIRALTRREQWTPSQQKMMRRAGQRYGRQSLIGLVVAVGLSLPVFWIYSKWLLANHQHERLLSAMPSDVTEIITQLDPYRYWIDPLLEKTIATDPNPTRVLHARLALLPTKHSELEEVYQQLLQSKPEEFEMICAALAPYWPELRGSLDKELNPENADAHRQLRAACALAKDRPKDSRWSTIGRPVLETLLSENPLAVHYWQAALKNAGGELLTPLAQIADQANLSTTKRQILAQIYRDYSSSIEKPQAKLEEQLAKKPTDPANNDPAVLGKAKASVAATLAVVGHSDKPWALLKFPHDTGDPTTRSHLIEMLAPTGVSFNELATRLQKESDVSIKRAMILAFGQYDRMRVTPAQQALVATWLLDRFEFDPDSGVHGACEWILGTWKYQDQLDVITKRLASPRIPTDRNWFINTHGQTYVIIDPPKHDYMGPPEIPGRYAIAAKEVTVEEFKRFRQMHFAKVEPPPLPRHPAALVNWYMAAEYCNWLNSNDGIENSQQCYLPNEKGKFEAGMKSVNRWPTRLGYRLPIEAEWNYASRANSICSFPCGWADDDLLNRYAWYVQGSRLLPSPTWATVASLKPNDLGLFDMLGNVAEWCHDEMREEIGGRFYVTRPVRGGTLTQSRVQLQNVIGMQYPPFQVHSSTGFRPVRILSEGENY